MTPIHLPSWNRREHFEFFNGFEEPYFGLTFEVEVQEAYRLCKERQVPFFLYYHFLATRVINAIDNFRYRIVDEHPVAFERIHATTTIMREDGTFSFSFMPYHGDLRQFVKDGQAEIARIQQTTGIGMKGKAAELDVVHFSTIPWVPFKGLTHARAFARRDSVPKISFGKITLNGNHRLMPVSIFSHHALVDGYHVGQFYEQFQTLLSEGQPDFW